MRNARREISNRAGRRLYTEARRRRTLGVPRTGLNLSFLTTELSMDDTNWRRSQPHLRGRLVVISLAQALDTSGTFCSQPCPLVDDSCWHCFRSAFPKLWRATPVVWLSCHTSQPPVFHRDWSRA